MSGHHGGVDGDWLEEGLQVWESLRGSAHAVWAVAHLSANPWPEPRYLSVPLVLGPKSPPEGPVPRADAYLCFQLPGKDDEALQRAVYDRAVVKVFDLAEQLRQARARWTGWEVSEAARSSRMAMDHAALEKATRLRSTMDYVEGILPHGQDPDDVEAGGAVGQALSSDTSQRFDGTAARWLLAAEFVAQRQREVQRWLDAADEVGVVDGPVRRALELAAHTHRFRFDQGRVVGAAGARVDHLPGPKELWELLQPAASSRDDKKQVKRLTARLDP